MIVKKTYYFCFLWSFGCYHWQKYAETAFICETFYMSPEDYQKFYWVKKNSKKVFVPNLTETQEPKFT